ncbi:MAG: hypothetical protein IM638_03350 [Bacteroidetes bacterium]|nr:hypothetical protein [Bacteroidota bacterium]
MRTLFSVFLLGMAILTHAQPKDSLMVFALSATSTGPSLEGMIYHINAPDGVSCSFVVREAHGDSVNLTINGKKQGPHLIYEGAADGSLWA